MKWFKHDSDANRDKKLQDLVLDYGMEAYGLYWYVIEQIAYGVGENNFTFELEPDSRIIAKDTGMQRQKVEDIIRYMVEIGLLEESNNAITCFKLLNRMDSSQTSNKKFRLMIQQAKELRAEKLIPKKSCQSHDTVMTQSCLSHELEVDVEVDIDKELKDPLVPDKSETSEKPKKQKKFIYKENHLRFAKRMFEKIKEVNGAFPEPNFEQWAHDARLMSSREKISLNEYWRVFLWANNDSFWQNNIQSPAKLRKQYPQLIGKMNYEQQQANARANNQPASSYRGSQGEVIAPYERMLRAARAAGHNV